MPHPPLGGATFRFPRQPSLVLHLVLGDALLRVCPVHPGGGSSCTYRTSPSPTPHPAPSGEPYMLRAEPPTQTHTPAPPPSHPPPPHHHIHTHTHTHAPLPLQLRAAEGEGGEVRYVQEDPRLPYRGAKIMSSQPQFLRDFSTGLNTTMFRWASHAAVGAWPGGRGLGAGP